MSAERHLVIDCHKNRKYHKYRKNHSRNYSQNSSFSSISQCSFPNFVNFLGQVMLLMLLLLLLQHESDATSVCGWANMGYTPQFHYRTFVLRCQAGWVRVFKPRYATPSSPALLPRSNRGEGSEYKDAGNKGAHVGAPLQSW